MDDLMNKTAYGRAAMKKFGAVADDFFIFSAGWVEDAPKDWKTMKVAGARFKGSRRIARTTMKTLVTAEEIEKEREAP